MLFLILVIGQYYLIFYQLKKLLDSFERFNGAIYLSANDIKKIIRLNDK